MSKLVRNMVNNEPHLALEEKAAIIQTLAAGELYGYGNIIAWLATEWACRLRDKWGLNEKAAIAAVSARGPYSLPKAEKPAP